MMLADAIGTAAASAMAAIPTENTAIFCAVMRKAGDILPEPVSDKWAFDVMEAF